MYDSGVKDAISPDVRIKISKDDFGVIGWAFFQDFFKLCLKSITYRINVNGVDQFPFGTQYG